MNAEINVKQIDNGWVAHYFEYGGGPIEEPNREGSVYAETAEEAFLLAYGKLRAH